MKSIQRKAGYLDFFTFDCIFFARRQRMIAILELSLIKKTEFFPRILQESQSANQRKGCDQRDQSTSTLDKSFILAPRSICGRAFAVALDRFEI
jgi:hypothetical protein